MIIIKLITVEGTVLKEQFLLKCFSGCIYHISYNSLFNKIIDKRNWDWNRTEINLHHTSMKTEGEKLEKQWPNYFSRCNPVQLSSTSA